MVVKSLKLISLFCFILLLSCEEKVNSQVTKTIEHISATDFKTKIDEKKVQLIDVRTPDEYSDGYIKGATNINFYGADFLAQISLLDKNKPVYVYCRSGNRSGKTASKLKQNGFTKIFDLKGGVLAWKAKGLKTETNE